MRGAREAQGCRAAMPQTQISPGILNEPLCRRSKQFVSFFLKLLNRDLAAGVGLQVGIKLIVLLHGRFPICAYTRAEFLKVHADPIEGQATATVRISTVIAAGLVLIAVRGLGLGKWVHNAGSVMLITLFALMLLFAANETCGRSPRRAGPRSRIAFRRASCSTSPPRRCGRARRSAS